MGYLLQSLQRALLALRRGYASHRRPVNPPETHECATGSAGWDQPCRRLAVAKTTASAIQDRIIVVPPIGAAKGKMRSPMKTCIASSAEKRIAPASMTKPTIRSDRADAGRNPSVRGDRRALRRRATGEIARPLGEFAAVLMHARRRQRDAGRAHERSDASENEGRAGHLCSMPAKSVGAGKAVPRTRACQDGRRGRSCWSRAYAARTSGESGIGEFQGARD